ncbi:hypothetical protein AC1031_015964 [Aphanomyces cochlioides]|nr:hypothetical protein AC1031_015964 [Aphanomyces cochlioides]
MQNAGHDGVDQLSEAKIRCAVVIDMHQRGWGAVDGDHSRDLQRRRQNEYHAALAEQVRMQEAKKKAEREERLRANASAAPTQAVQGGLFAGLGENHVVGKRFARGHHVEKMAADVRRSTQGAAPPPQSQQHLGYNEPPQFDHGQYHHPVEPYMQPSRMEPPQFAGYPNEGYKQQPPQQHFQPPGSHHAQFPTNEYSPPLPQPPQHAMNQPSPPPPTSLQPVPGTSHGRRHVRGAAPVDSSRRNAQIEAQAMLKQQMEENQRRKQEAKRQQELEERLELERIQREVKLQEEALEAEKKAKQKEAMAKQQQLEADLRLKQEDQLRKNPKHRQKLVDDAPPPPAQPTGTSLSPPDHGQGFQDAVNAPWNGMQQMQQTPRDPPPPLWSQPAPTHGVGGDLFHPGGQGYDGQSFPPQQQIFNQPLAFHHNMYPPPGMPTMQQMPSMTHLNPPPKMNGFQSPPSMGQFAMDERLQMLAAELARQRALVEQLVMQPTVRNGGITVEDFEKLRREMQEELDRRDARHKQELEAWKLRAETLERQSTQGRVNGLSRQPSVNRSFVHGESNQVDQDDETFSMAAADRPFPGNNDTNPSKSPQKPFPGLNGSYKLQRPEPSPSKASVMEQGESTFVSNSPQRPFPGVNGTYKFNADLQSKQDNPSRAMATKQSFPEQRSARKMQSKAQRLESNQEDDDNAFNSTTFSKAGASPARSVKFASTSSTRQSSPTTSPAKPQDEREAYASKTPEKPFPGVNATYNIPSSHGKSPPKAALKTQPNATTSTRNPIVSTSGSSSSPPKQRRVSPRQRPSPHKSPPRTQPTLAQQRQQRRPVQTSPQKIPKQFAVVNLLNDATTPVAASQTLKCESQMIYFDGKVDPSTQLETEFRADQHLGESAASNMLSPRFNALFSHPAASNDAAKGLLTSRTVNSTTEPPPLHQEPIQLGSKPTTLPDVPASFRVQEVKPSTAMSFRYGAHASILPATASSPTASFDINDLYEKNTARCELLEQLEKTKSPAPQHVEELVSTFRRITSRKAARPQDGDEVRTTSNWVGDGLPKWLK